MRIYRNMVEAVREIERDMGEMGIRVHPQTMQDKQVGDDPDYDTVELPAYGFQLNGWAWNLSDEIDVVTYLFEPRGGEPVEEDGSEETSQVLEYIKAEHEERTMGVACNPGKAWQKRPQLWAQFLHNNRFAYTYPERIAPQLNPLYRELRDRPETRQATLTFHTKINCQSTNEGPNRVVPSPDMTNMGGTGRIPCSMHYQLMRRLGKLDLIYVMRSCDFLTHFAVDVMLATRFQLFMARQLDIKPGLFTFFSGSLHAYKRDIDVRHIF